jgi:aspartate aminotransferase/aminotransferase
MDVSGFLSDRCSAVEFSGIRKYFDLASAATHPIDLSIGQPDYDAELAIKDAAIAAIREGANRYTPSAGLPELRARIGDELRAECPDCDPAVLVSCGVSGGLTLSLMALVNPGDEVVFCDPFFISYKQLVRMMGGVPVAVSSYPDFKFNAEAVEKAITPKTKLLMINSPSNPTGVVMSDDDMKAAAAIARKHDIMLLSDEIYRELTFDGPPTSPIAHAPERTILLRGYGKTYGVTGWRLGYVAAPAALIDQMTKLQQYTFVCAPSPMQAATLTALKTDVSHHRRDYAKKRDLVCDLLGEAFEMSRPGGGFYVFPKAPARFGSGDAFCAAAAKEEVFVIPGGMFSTRDTHFRVSFGTSDEKLRKGCDVLCRVARGG